MASKMLIDTTHPEETRVVVVDGQRLDEFDFESASRKQLAGNIYLAKVMRVEPSLQACFVDYGGNRHGFLAFSEIHPDYYQVSPAERAAITAAQERSMAAAEERSRSGSDDEQSDGRGGSRGNGGERHDRGGRGDDRRGNRRGRGGRDRDRGRERNTQTEADGEGRRGSRRVAKPRGGRSRKRTKDGSYIEREFRIGGGVRVRVVNPNDTIDLDLLEREFSIGGSIPVRVLRLTDEERGIAPDDEDRDDDKGDVMAMANDDLDRVTSDDRPSDADREAPEALGGQDEFDEPPLPKVRLRDYKIQDVIKRRQIMLIQINKEERGNKGAAVTTYLSLAGRYCVLMPNTAKGGGISRKIVHAGDRKRLKEIAGNLEVPRGMGLIIRTAGAQRTDAEIRRDYEYLLRQWDAVRSLTLESYAPAAIYEEGSLIKRSLRDLFTKEIEEILVDGEAGYEEARDYVAMLMPSQEKAVRLHRGKSPLFIEHGVEDKLTAMFNPTVQLKSGGYIVIGVTEALVAVDVNSGRSTRESSIEDTATKTNLEAADEVARQMRLRDLAGLIVIDFIDMNERRNNAAVEKRLKDALANDRARIQVGRISSFGLLEMSRQRLRPGMIEATTTPCPHCHGTGLLRSDDTLALTILREIEEEGLRRSTAVVQVKAPVSVANFLHNQKRDRVFDIERRYGIRVVIEGDMATISPDFTLTKMKLEDAPEHLRPVAVVESAAVSMESVYADADDGDAGEDAPEAVEVAPEARGEQDEERPDSGRRRARRGGRDREDRSDPMPVVDAGATEEAGADAPFSYGDAQPNGKDADDEGGRGGSRRSRRGGKRRGGGGNKRNEPPREFGEASALSMLAGQDALDRALPDLFKQEGAILVKRDDAAKAETKAASEPEAEETSQDTAKAEPEEAAEAAPAETPAPKKKPRARRKTKAEKEAEAAQAAEAEAVEEKAAEIVAEAREEVAEETRAKPKRASRAKAAPKAPEAEPTPSTATPTDPDKPKRTGWWSR